MGFSRQEYWSELPFPPPGDLPDPAMESTSLMSPTLADHFFTTSATWEAHSYRYLLQISTCKTVCFTWEVPTMFLYYVRSYSRHLGALVNNNSSKASKQGDRRFGEPWRAKDSLTVIERGYFLRTADTTWSYTTFWAWSPLGTLAIHWRQEPASTDGKRAGMPWKWYQNDNKKPEGSRF